MKNKHSFKFGFQYQRVFDRTKTNDTGSLLTTNFSNLQTAGFNASGALLSGGGIGTNITAANFGKVSAQTNLPRVVQFGLRAEF